MPYTATTPTLVLCQALATFVKAAWNPTAPDAVDWDFFRRWGDADDLAAAKLAGRQVLFLPSDEYEWDTETRALNQYRHHVVAWVLERYTGTGDAPRDWTAQRVDFVHDEIVKGLRFTQKGPAPFNPFVLTVGASVQVCDVEKLMSANKLFYAAVSLEFTELVTP